MKTMIQKIENLKIKSLLMTYVECIENEDISSHDKEILQSLKFIEHTLLDKKEKSTSNILHDNLNIWQNIFNEELSKCKNSSLTLEHVKNMISSFMTSATPSIELQDNNSKIKQLDLHIYLQDDHFKSQLNSLAENNISAFELLSTIFGNNNFQTNVEQTYFYGFALGETQNLFE